MKRKRMIKLLMSQGIQRNEAVAYADACGPELPHNLMGFMVTVHPEIRALIGPCLSKTFNGAPVRIHFDLCSE